MPARIKKKQLHQLIRNAVKASKDGGKEICGLIVDTGYFLELIQVKNKSKTGGTFEFYTPEIRRINNAALIINYEIVGTFHSHPLDIAKPGVRDLVDSEENDLMLIIDCLNKEAILWEIMNGVPKKIKVELI